MKDTISMKFWWSMPQEELLTLLHVDGQKGLSSSQVTEYRKKFGSFG